MQNKRKYPTFKAVDFISDSAFFCWVTYPDESSDAFWTEYVSTHPEQKEEIENAISLIGQVKLKKSKLTEEEKLRIFQQIILRSESQKRKKIYSRTLQVAAIVAVFLSATHFLFREANQEIAPQEKPFDLETFATTANTISSDSIQLIVSDSTKTEIAEGDMIKYTDNGIFVTGKKAARAIAKVSKTVYNKLVVPNGKISTLEFADGTKMWVSSGSVVVYPVAFEAHKREIFVEGEIYLQVKHDKARPFFVKTTDYAVKVLGTEFNLSAYKNDLTNSIVLVNGEVEVNIEKTNKYAKLSPNQKLNISNDGVKIANVNVEKYISWRYGYFSFDEEKLNSIINRISRFYRVEVVYDENVSDITCSGSLNIKGDLKETLQNITSTAPLEYRIEDQTLYISKKKPKVKEKEKLAINK